MRVQDIMTISCITAPPETPVLEARQMMLEKRIRHLLVVDGTTLMGIVTDRDIRLNLPSPATSLSVWEINYLLARMTLASVMTKNVVTPQSTPPPTRPARAASLSVWEINYLLARMTLASVMTKNVVTAESSREATEAAQL